MSVFVLIYLLIFGFSRIQANKAAIKAMVLNRIGYFGLVIRVLIFFVVYNAVYYATVFAVIPLFSTKSFNFLSINFDLISVLCLFFICRCSR